VTEADRELRRLLAELDRSWHELSQAEFAGIKSAVLEARSEIQRLHALVRKHCDEHGLSLPSDVPKGGASDS